MVKKKHILSNKILKILYLHDCTKRKIISLYQYFTVYNPESMSSIIKKVLKKYDVLGRIYISKEGINIQISVPKRNIKYVVNFFRNMNAFTKKININFSIENQGMAFWKLQVKVRRQLVSNNFYSLPILGVLEKKYLNAFEVNKIFYNTNTVFVDIRNHYEYEIGHFQNALEIPANTFREQLDKLKDFLKPYIHKKIVLYCTGGIRCEKAAALLTKHNFQNIYQIYGGILGYINQVKKNNLSMYFKGKIFVFDERLTERITKDVFSICRNCKKITDRAHINCLNSFCHRLFIQCLSCSKKFKSYCSEKCLNIS